MSIIDTAINAMVIQIVQPIGARLSTEDQIFLSAHYKELPAYLSSPEGGRIMTEVIKYFKNYIEPPNLNLDK